MEQQQYLQQFQAQLTQQLLRLATDAKALEGQLLETADLEARWEDIAAAYLVDGVKEIADYPHVAVGWMVYVGMAMAQLWDTDWERVSQQSDLYALVRDPRGFDCLDEWVREDLLGMQRDGEDYRACENLVRALAQSTLDAIRHENVEPQSPLAFHIYTHSLHALFQIGIAIELFRLGYRYSKLQ
ncbi:MAG: hypothetical protein HUK09_05965 [Bacteroidaceae bacterium]|nr:hypothetical protein [Bacteroidaceae bacterium]